MEVNSINIYLDNSATTRPVKAALDAVVRVVGDNYGNPSSLHRMGLEAEREVESARETVARAMRVSSENLYFTSGGTESDNLAILGVAAANYKKGHMVTTKIEHKAVLEPFKKLEAEGWEVSYVNVNRDGKIDLDHLKDVLREDTCLCSIMQVNNETGAIQPLAEAEAIIRKFAPRAVFHVDAVQALGKVPLNSADLISVSAHKIGGLKGIGALFIKKGVKIRPIMYGGGQERAIRSGTENVPGIVSFGAACKELNLAESYEHVTKLNKIMREYITKNNPDVKIISVHDALPYILSISFPGVKAEVLLHTLETRGVYVSSGSACASNQPAPSYVLTAMGLSREVIDGTIRISFCPENTQEEAETAARVICEAVNELSEAHRKR